jgi:hypothetical protein
VQEKKKRGSNIGSLVGPLIFILIFLARPLIGLFRNITGGTLSLPANLTDLIPIAVGAIVVITIAVSAVRALGRTRRGDERLPTDMSTPRTPNTSMPPFSGPQAPRLPNTLPARPTKPARLGQASTPATPRFEPILNPRVVIFGIVGLVLLGVLALVVLGLSLP